MGISFDRVGWLIGRAVCALVGRGYGRSVFILLGVRLSRQATRRTTVKLLAHWLVPLSLALLVWRVRSFSHPRYVVMYTIGLIMLAAYLIWPGRGGNRKDAKDTKLKQGKVPGWEWLLSGLLTVGLLLLSGWGLYHYYFAPNTAKDDMRAVARYLEVTAVAGDLILVPDTDYSFEFEYAGAATVAMPSVDQPDQMWLQLADLTTGVPRVFALDYKRGTRDWQRIVPFVLENAGTLVAETEVDALIVREYLLETAVTRQNSCPCKHTLVL